MERATTTEWMTERLSVLQTLRLHEKEAAGILFLLIVVDMAMIAFQ